MRPFFSWAVAKESELRDAIEHNPFNTDVGKALHFFFLESEVKNSDLATLKSLRKENEEFKLRQKVFYLYAPDGIGRSKLVEKIGSALGDVQMTARNWNTVNKLMGTSINWERSLAFIEVPLCPCFRITPANELLEPVLCR